MKVCLALIALLPIATCFASGLTEEEAVSIGLERSFGVRTAESQLRKAKQQTRQALGSLGFRLDGSAVYERYEPSRLTGGGGGESDGKRASLSLSYPIDLVGLRGQALKAAKSNEEASASGISIEANNTKEAIRNAYYNVLLAEWQFQVQDSALQSARARLANSQKLFNSGAIARFDVLRFETEVSRAESSLEAAKNGVTLAKQLLNQAMSREVNTEVELDTPYRDVQNDNLPRYTLTEADLLQRAYSTRPELQQLNHLLLARQFFTKTERGGLTPSLTLQALYVKTFDPGSFTRENAVTVGATLSFPLWDSGITRARVAAAREDEVQTKLAQDRTKLGISLEVQSALIKVRNALAQLEFAKKTVTMQTEALRLAELRYEAREGILLDVTTADSDLRAALGSLAKARTDYLNAIASLKKAIGSDELPLNP